MVVYDHLRVYFTATRSRKVLYWPLTLQKERYRGLMPHDLMDIIAHHRLAL
jgi:hypothetical protein